MADTAQTADTTSTADTGTTTGNDAASKTATQTQAAAGQTQTATKPDAPQTLTVTAEQLAAAVEQAVEKRLAERTKGLEEKVAARVTTPIEARGLIESFRAEMKAAGLYLPKDDDRTAEDESQWGDIASLDPEDHGRVIRTTKDGGKVTKLQVEINRLRAKFKEHRKPQKTGDQLGTPPAEPGDANEFDRIRKETLASEQAAREARKSGQARVFAR